MARPVNTRFDTLALHAGQRPDPVHGARAVPIYQTASYVFKDSDQAASLFNMERPGHAYARLSNPTTAVFEERIAALEDGIGGIATASGQAALHLAIATIMDAGSHIVSSSAIYGGSHNLLQYTLSRFGIDTTFVSPRDIDGIRAAIRPNTRMIFGEVIGNPGNDIMNVPVVAEIARENRIPLMIDSTFTTPYLMKPFEYGAHLIMHSATKFLCGHGTVIGGVVVDQGRFNWEQSGKFQTLSDPYEGFHGMSFDEESTQGAFLLRARREGMRDFGACMSPTVAFYVLQGMETLSMRMERHVSNTRKIIEFLHAREEVEAISYPELPEHPDYRLARELLPRGAGSVFSFVLKGGRNAGRVFTENMEIFSHLANVGDAKSLIIHPASTTHYRMSAEDLLKAGIHEGTIRMSVGLEDVDDLLEDLSRGLHLAKKQANR
ncbi:MAG: O-acetylhomoserine aminocarboxypropyltransferase [Gammaproteobacteria bacterium]|nr:O-acetylhomoserine aminocarboxypropyltransferase [Gammaproteobacteria bacterium]